MASSKNSVKMKKTQKQQQLGNEFVKSAGGKELPTNLKDISFHFDEQSKKDCQYGYSTKSLVLKDNTDGHVYDPRRFKGVFQNDEYRTTVSRVYAVIPNEVVEEMQKPLIDEGRLKLVRTIETGFAKRWEFETKDAFRVKGSKDKNDIHGVRLVFSNSIDGGVALGVTVRTFRQICSNGLMGWGIDFQNKLIHYGDADRMLKIFPRGIMQASNIIEKMHQLLERLTQIKISKETISYIIKKAQLSKLWIPEWVNIQETKGQGFKVLGLNEKKKPATLYEATNDFTYLLSRADKTHPEHNKVKGELSFLGVTQREQALTRAVQKIVIGKGRIA